MRRERLRREWRQEDLANAASGYGVKLHPSAFAKMEREPDPAAGIEPRMIRLDEAAVIGLALDLTITQMLSDDDLTEPGRRLEWLQAELRKSLDHAEDARRRVGELNSQILELTGAASQERARLARLIEREESSRALALVHKDFTPAVLVRMHREGSVNLDGLRQKINRTGRREAPDLGENWDQLLAAVDQAKQILAQEAQEQERDNPSNAPKDG
jgi:hypothetical protein